MNAPPDAESRRSSHRLEWWAGVRTVLFALGGIAIGLLVAAHVRAGIGPFEVAVSARPSFSNDTVVRLGPFGTIRLDTHRGPLQLEARVEDLRVPEAEAIARDPAVLEQFEAQVEGDARSAMVRLARRAALAAVVGGLLGTVLSSLRWRALLLGSAVVVAVVGGGALGTVKTWRAEALAEPRYSGLLTFAPQMVGDVEAIVNRFGEYRAQLADLVRNVAILYNVGQGLPTFDPARATIRVLHVSDVHLNPQAFDVMRTIIREMRVDAVVDTGDTTDWGSEPESQFLDGIERLGVPYAWVRGNHDSELTAAAIAAKPNAVVLDGEVREVAGLRMWGFPDPRYTPDKSRETGRDVEREQAEALAPQVAAALATVRPPVDLVAVHDPRLAVGVGQLTPLVLAGHTHEPRRSNIGDALLLVEGSTGGAGLRGLQGRSGPEPLTCSVLYFDPGSRRVVAFDRITVSGLGESGARIERHLVHPREPVEATTSTSSTSPATTPPGDAPSIPIPAPASAGTAPG